MEATALSLVSMVVLCMGGVAPLVLVGFSCSFGEFLFLGLREGVGALAWLGFVLVWL